MENEVKTGSPKEGWPSPFVWSLGWSHIQFSPISMSGLHGPVQPHFPPLAATWRTGTGCFLLKGFGKVWELEPHRCQRTFSALRTGFDLLSDPRFSAVVTSCSPALTYPSSHLITRPIRPPRPPRPPWAIFESR